MNARMVTLHLSRDDLTVLVAALQDAPEGTRLADLAEAFGYVVVSDMTDELVTETEHLLVDVAAADDLELPEDSDGAR